MCVCVGRDAPFLSRDSMLDVEKTNKQKKRIKQTETLRRGRQPKAERDGFNPNITFDGESQFGLNINDLCPIHVFLT